MKSLLLAAFLASLTASPTVSDPIVFLYGHNGDAQLLLATRDVNEPFVVDPAALALSLTRIGVAQPRTSLISDVKGPQTAIVPPPASPYNGVANFSQTYVVALTFPIVGTTQSGMYRVRIEARSGKPSFAGAEVHPELLYVASDSPVDIGLEKARSTYLNRTVYVAPSTGYDGGIDWPGDTAWRVVDVRRDAGAVELGYFSSTDPDFVALNPLRITLRSGAQTTVMIVADPWEAGRKLLRRSPLDHPEWPAEMRAAIKKGTVIAGMTHEMVASVLGYPAAYGSIEELDRLSRWDYDAPTPFQSTVYFKGDRVVHYDPPGDLP
jgi:hypothetical protein